MTEHNFEELRSDPGLKKRLESAHQAHQENRTVTWQKMKTSMIEQDQLWKLIGGGSVSLGKYRAIVAAILLSGIAAFVVKFTRWL